MAKEKKTLIIGDVHCKTDTIVPIVDAAIQKYGVEKVIFVGDYFDEWNIDDNGIYEAIDALIEWRDKKADEGIEVVFLAGNHDYAYIDFMALCTGHHFDAEPFAFKRLTEFMDIQLAEVVGGKYLLTHAGVTETYRSEILSDSHTIEEICDALNEQLDDVIKKAKKMVDQGLVPGGVMSHTTLLSSLGRCGFERGGTASFSGPLWCGFNELQDDPIFGISQITGHTPTKTVVSLLSSDDIGNETRLIWCDTFTVAPDMSPMGDFSFLFWDGEETLSIVYPYKKDGEYHFTTMDAENWD